MKNHLGDDHGIGTEKLPNKRRRVGDGKKDLVYPPMIWVPASPKPTMVMGHFAADIGEDYGQDPDVNLEPGESVSTS